MKSPVEDEEDDFLDAGSEEEKELLDFSKKKPVGRPPKKNLQIDLDIEKDIEEAEDQE